jgi:hypothetical protein
VSGGVKSLAAREQLGLKLVASKGLEFPLLRFSLRLCAFAGDLRKSTAFRMVSG